MSTKKRHGVPPLQRIPRWSPCSRTRDALVKYLQCRAKEDVVCGEAGMRTAASFGAIAPVLEQVPLSEIQWLT